MENIKLIEIKEDIISESRVFNPNVAKVGGLQIQGAKGEAIVNYCEPFGTPDLKFSGFPEGEKRWPKIDPILKCTLCSFLKTCMNLPLTLSP